METVLLQKMLTKSAIFRGCGRAVQHLSIIEYDGQVAVPVRKPSASHREMSRKFARRVERQLQTSPSFYLIRERCELQHRGTNSAIRARFIGGVAEPAGDSERQRPTAIYQLLHGERSFRDFRARLRATPYQVLGNLASLLRH
jgi:hypothetical protein